MSFPYQVFFKFWQKGREVGVSAGVDPQECWQSLCVAAVPVLALADTFNSAVILWCLISPQTTLILHTEMLHCRAHPLPL